MHAFGSHTVMWPARRAGTMSFLNSPSWLSDRESYQLPAVILPPESPFDLQATPFTTKLRSLPPPPSQPVP